MNIRKLSMERCGFKSHFNALLDVPYWANDFTSLKFPLDIFTNKILLTC